MTSSGAPFSLGIARGLVLAALVPQLSGCAVVAVAGAAASVAATGVGLAVDATVGAARLTGKAIGAVAGGEPQEPEK